jgi:hypothetical protein
MKKRLSMLVMTLMFLAAPIWAAGGERHGARVAGSWWTAVSEMVERVGEWLGVNLAPPTSPDARVPTQSQTKADCGVAIDPTGRCKP